MDSPSLIVVVQIARSPQTVADQVVFGLVSGSLVGPGLVIQKREAMSIRFSSLGGALPTVPDQGEIVLFEESSGGTRIECRLWCRKMGHRRLLQAVLLGALVASVAALAFGWLIHVSIPASGLASIAWDLLTRHRDRTRLRRQVEAFAHNTSYLKTM